jgi:hypothetical protein
MSIFYKGQPRNERIYRLVALVSYLVCFGFAIPFMVVVPFVRLNALWEMSTTNNPALLGPDLSLLFPFAVSLYYLFYGKTIRHMFARNIWFRPLMLYAALATLVLTITAHACYLAAGAKVNVIPIAILGLFIWRLAVAMVSMTWPHLLNFNYVDAKAEINIPSNSMSSEAEQIRKASAGK